MKQYSYKMPFSELKVLSEDEALDLVKRQPDKWNVVSLWADFDWIKSDPTTKPHFPKALDLCQQNFHDIINECDQMILCNQDHLKGIIKFGRKTRGQPLLVHCQAGISRSTAVAVLLILDAIKDESANPFEDALDIVYAVRPIMQPNPHILKIGLPLVAKDEYQAMSWIREAKKIGVL